MLFVFNTSTFKFKKNIEVTLTKCMLKPCNNKFFTHTHTPMELLNSIVPIYGKANFPLGPGTSPNGRTSGASWATEWE